MLPLLLSLLVIVNSCTQVTRWSASEVFKRELAWGTGKRLLVISNLKGLSTKELKNKVLTTLLCGP